MRLQPHSLTDAIAGELRDEEIRDAVIRRVWLEIDECHLVGVHMTWAATGRQETEFERGSYREKEETLKCQLIDFTKER